jgi:hypothetical protein
MSIVLPMGMSFRRWAATLQVDYSTEDVPLPPPEDQWQGWAQRLVERNVFQNDQIPNPIGFKGWQDWAIRVAQVLSA